MKLIIDMPKKIEEYIKDYIPIGAGDNVFCYPDEIVRMIQNGTPIPDNATNGDVIKAMFPKDVKVITQHDDFFGRRFIDLRVGQLDCELDDDWWNSPYQKGGKE